MTQRPGPWDEPALPDVAPPRRGDFAAGWLTTTREPDLALAEARRAIDALPYATCLLDPRARILHCNPAWDRFALRHGGEGRSTGAALRGRSYAACVSGDALARRLGGLVRQAAEGAPAVISAACHTATTAHLITATYVPVKALGGQVAGVVAAYEVAHAFPVEDLFEPQAPSPAHLGPDGRLEACSNCSRVRRRDLAVPTWEFVPAYLEPHAPPMQHTLCATCFSDLFGLTRG